MKCDWLRLRAQVTFLESLAALQLYSTCINLIYLRQHSATFCQFLEYLENFHVNQKEKEKLFITSVDMRRKSKETTENCSSITLGNHHHKVNLQTCP